MLYNLSLGIAENRFFDRYLERILNRVIVNQIFYHIVEGDSFMLLRVLLSLRGLESSWREINYGMCEHIHSSIRPITPKPINKIAEK